MIIEKSSFLFTWNTTNDENEIEEIVESFIISILQTDGLIDLWKVTYPL
jgi:hypothetical protein